MSAAVYVQLEYWVPMERDKAIDLQAKVLCVIAGMEPIDSMDGSPNWWVFQADAAKIVDEIRGRFPSADTPGQRSQEQK